MMTPAKKGHSFPRCLLKLALEHLSFSFNHVAAERLDLPIGLHMIGILLALPWMTRRSTYQCV